MADAHSGPPVRPCFHGGGEHDWAILLDQWGWLERDQAVGRAVYLLGVLFYLAALAVGWVMLKPGTTTRQTKALTSAGPGR